MRNQEIYLTRRENGGIVRKNSRGYVGKDGVRNVNCRWFPFVAGFILAIILPFLVDLLLFGTPVPCQTIQVFEDGSSVQKCSVRN